MKALQVERSLPRFAVARVASEWRAGAGGRLGPLRLADLDPPALPGEGWLRLWPRLSGICGSDLATVDGRSSRWFEPVVSFPFVPGHEVVADTEDGRRVVVEPVLGCQARAVYPPCPACASGRARHCVNISGGHLAPGLQTGYCQQTGGGWSLVFVAHESQVHDVPEDLPDEAAVLVEPAACAVHAALAAPGRVPTEGEGLTAVVIGAGTLGLCAIGALSRFRDDIGRIIAVAKYGHQRDLAARLGASTVAAPGELRRAVRRATGSWILSNGQLSGGAPLVLDCVGSSESLAQALAVASPGGHVVLAGMPVPAHTDLTPLWQREITLMGSYTYGPEPAAGGRHSFDLAMELARAARLERLLSATYPLEQAAAAIEHAAGAGRRGAVKVAFDLRSEKKRPAALPAEVV
ncbi:MAG TPA: zinc-binding dehydrogenase [Acidimicrobiales bacterium]|nr:zinc-binding dehydrogenase [Acidimicrobiales bacterium]